MRELLDRRPSRSGARRSRRGRARPGQHAGRHRCSRGISRPVEERGSTATAAGRLASRALAVSPDGTRRRLRQRRPRRSTCSTCDELRERRNAFPAADSGIISLADRPTTRAWRCSATPTDRSWRATARSGGRVRSSKATATSCTRCARCPRHRVVSSAFDGVLRVSDLATGERCSGSARVLDLLAARASRRTACRHRRRSDLPDLGPRAGRRAGQPPRRQSRTRCTRSRRSAAAGTACSSAARSR